MSDETTVTDSEAVEEVTAPVDGGPGEPTIPLDEADPLAGADVIEVSERSAEEVESIAREDVGPFDDEVTRPGSGSRELGRPGMSGQRVRPGSGSASGL